jgi:hypothetical protein
MLSIPYQPSADPNQYYSQGLNNLVGGFLGKSQRAMQAQDLQNLALYTMGGLQKMPMVKTQLGQNLAGELLGRMATSQGGRVGTLPGWWPYATETQKQGYLNRVGGPMSQVNIGGQPWRAGFVGQPSMGEEAVVEHLQKTEPTPSERKTAIDIMKDIIFETPTPWWGALGAKNFRQGALTEAYKNYRIQNNYDGLTEKKRNRLDEIWDNQIKVWNKIGYKGHGKNEFQWNPDNSEIQRLRKGSKTVYPPSISTNGKFDRDKFLAEVARLKAVDLESARRFYNMWSPVKTK